MIRRRANRPGWLRRRLGSGDRATALLEFALVAPVFILGFAGVVDLGLATFVRIRLETALASGSSYALLPSSLTLVVATPSGANAATLAGNIAALVATSDPAPTLDAAVVVNNGPTVTVTAGVAASGGSASGVDTSYYCPTGSPPNWTWGSAVAQGTACAGGGTAGQFITITASYNYQALFPAAYHIIQSGTMTLGTAVQTR